MDNVEECINEFLNYFLTVHHEEYSTLFDNLDVFLDLMYYVRDEINDFSTKYSEIDDFTTMTKMNLFEKVKLINTFYSSHGITFDFDELINKGIFNPLFVLNEEDNLQNNAHFVQGMSIVKGDYKSIDVYDNGLLTDAVIWFHETVHYRNQIKNNINHVVDLFSEVTAFAEEFIFIDYLEKIGFSKDANFIKAFELKNFRNIVIDGIYVTKVYLTYITFGKVTKENYNMLFTDEYYEDTLYIFIKEINDNPTIIFTLIWYTIACILSICMYGSYKKDANYFDTIEKLNLDMENFDVTGFLNVMGLTGYDEESKEKIKDGFDIIKKEIGDYYENKRVQWVKCNFR